MVWLEAAFIVFTFCFFCFFAWHTANRALDKDSYIEPHFVEWTDWWAQYGLLPPFAAVILFALAAGSALFIRGRAHRRTRVVRTFTTQDPAGDFEPTPEEQEMERRIDDVLDRDGR